MSDLPITAAQIEDYLHEVADELANSGLHRELVMVGGALLAMHGLRDATHDVDSGTRLDPEFRDAVARVASRHGLAPKWLNDSAAGYVPVTLNLSDCQVLVNHPALLVRGAPLEQVFLMKLYASRATDMSDLEALWPLCSFRVARASSRGISPRVPASGARPASRRPNSRTCLTAAPHFSLRSRGPGCHSARTL